MTFETIYWRMELIGPVIDALQYGNTYLEFYGL
jgi:hypothetical protein